jgi:ribose transport system ATP-binding protein
MQCSPDALVSSLSEVERAMVAILRALDQVHDLGQGVLILDEPTAYLPRDGVTRLFSAVRSVAARGVGVLLVTHRLDEIRHYTERVTVLRNGELVASEQTSSLSEERLVELILGRTIDDMYPPSHSAEGDVALVVDGLRGPGLSSPLSLQVHAGEIVGLTGLVGMGYELPLYLLSGANQATAGTLSLFGSGVEINTMTPRRALDLGIALLPADRLGAGGAGAATVRENVTLPSLGQFFHLGVLRHRSEEASVGVLLERFSVIPPSPMAVFGTLSGGNQQKALMAKWFATEPKVLLLHEPTHGVDVGARQQLFSYIRDLAAAGTSVIIASAEYEDLARLCDRVLVFRNGAVVAAVSGSALTEERLVQLSFLDTSTVGASAVQP